MRTLPIVSIEPPTGSILVRAPSELIVHFDRRINPPSDANDFRLDRFTADGTWSSLSSQGNSLAETLDGQFRSMDLTISTPLPPGRYRLVLLAGATLSGLDGTPASAGADRTVDDFTIAGSGLDKATDIVLPSSTVVDSAGALDLTANPNAVDLYRVVLPAGHFWRLGVQVDSMGMGSPLRAALAVFDSNGHLIEASKAGRPATPSDPYLYVGLAPGVYYVGISGAGNVPGAKGGYDPAMGSSGSAPAGSASGVYRLDMVADIADAPTPVRSFALDFADPTANIPTGLTLRFNGAVDERAMVGYAGDLISVVDASGRTWGVMAVGYDEAKAEVAFLFERPLPPGHYQVLVGGLVDLTGRPPVAVGLPPGVLGSFDVTPAAKSADPNGLGPILPDVAGEGFGAALSIGAGQAVTTRMVLPLPGCVYDFTTEYTGGQPTISVVIDGKPMPLDAGSPGVAHSHFLTLGTGTVEIIVTGGTGGTKFVYGLQVLSFAYDVLLDNGVGQTSALSLRLIAPGSSPGADPTPTPAPAPASVGGEASAASAPTSQVGLYVNTVLVGHPSGRDEPIAPASLGGATLASSNTAANAPGIATGYGVRLQPQGRNASGTLRALLDVPEASDELLQLPGDVDAEFRIASERTSVGQATTTPGEPGVVGSVLERVSEGLAGLFMRGRRIAASTSAGATVPDDIALTGLGLDAGSTGPGDGGRVETADLSNALGVAAIAVVLSQGHRRLGRWLLRRRAATTALVVKPDPRGPRHG
jgi:hypothetical protein